MRITSIADIEALESQGFEAIYPHRTPYDLILASARRNPDAVALHYLEDCEDASRDRILTYAQLIEHIDAAARLFRDLGVGRGRAVALLTPHTASAQIALWGAQRVGCASPINPMLRPDHIATLLAEADAALVVMMGVNRDQDYWSTLLPGLRAAGVTLPILDCDADGECPGSDGRFEDLLAARLASTRSGGDGSVTERDHADHGDEHARAALYHTGGTTGAPKLVCHTRLNEAHVARSCALMHDLRDDDVVLNGFPLFHVAGAFVYGLSTLSAGGRLLIPGRLGMRNRAFTSRIWQQVEKHRITMLGVVPTLMAGFNSVPVGDADLSSLRAALTGGSPLPPELADAFERKVGVPVRNIFGMTECSGCVATEPLHGPRTPNACGLRLPFSRVEAIADDIDETDTVAVLPAGRTGIIALRGPNVSPGYSNPERGRDTLREDGWLVSGDLGHVDAEGRIFVTGRKKDVIIRGGHNIDPQGIEDALLAHESVLTAAAVGMPDAYAGELPVVFVALRPGADASASMLLDFLKTRIEEPAALPKRIEILSDIPVTPIGKIFKPALRRIAIAWALADAAAACGVSEGEGGEQATIQVDESLAARVFVPQARVAALRQQVAGMPIQVSIAAHPQPSA